MSAMRKLSTRERRNRLGVRHLLAEAGTSPVDIADAMVVLHASDPATVYLSAVARLHDPSLDAVNQSMFADRELVRMLAMRRTLFVASRSVLPLIQQSSSIEIAARERKVLVKALEAAGVSSGEAWIEAARNEILAALGEEGMSARQLTDVVPRLKTRIVVGSGRFTQDSGSTSRTLGVLGAEGTLVRGEPAGNWTGRQYTWHERSAWLGWEPPLPDPGAAAAELAERWLRAFGPATFNDLRWWTGWTVAKLRAALGALEVEEIDLDGEIGLMLTSDVGPTPEPEPWAALLPSLDPTPMGWKDRDWFLGNRAGPLFDRNGNIGPTVWVDGRIVGGWGQTPSGEIVLGLLEDMGSDSQSLVDLQVERLERCLGDTIVRPSFPTPLQKQLSSPD